MRRIRLILEYDGTRYAGWQRQINALSIQQVLEEALSKITKSQVTLHASGRTDSGVHALAQVAHFDTAACMPADKFPYALNALLPKDIRIRYADEAPGGFHARFSARSKRYRYTILHAQHARAFYCNTALHVHAPLDLPRMHSVAEAFLGTHDFSAYHCANTHVRDAVRTIFLSNWRQEGDFLYYTVEGSGFLYNMVRIMVGTMLDIGKHTLPPEAAKAALQSGLRADAGATAPAHGLMLMRVCYDQFSTDEYI